MNTVVTAPDPTSTLTQAIRDHDPSMRALAFRLLGDRDVMDDVLQDAYTSAFRAFGRFRGTASVGTWLYRIVYNACIDELRRRRPEVIRLGDADRPVEDPTEAAAHRADLAGALASLTPEQRAAVLLVDAEGFSYAEAGRICGVPAGTVGSRLVEARRILRLALRIDEGDEDR